MSKQECIVESKVIRQAISKTNVSLFPSWFSGGETSKGQELFMELKCQQMKIDSFTSSFFQSDIYKQRMIMSVGTKMESIILHHLNMDVPDILSYNRLCHQILVLCYDTLIKAATDKNRNSLPFEVRWYRKISQLTISALVPAYMKSYPKTVQWIAVFWISDCIEELLKKYVVHELYKLRESSVPNTGNKCNKKLHVLSEVQRFGGWAINKMNRKLSKDKIYSDSERINIKYQVEILNSMSISTFDALISDEYCREFYPKDIRLHNQGGLTLVSNTFIPWFTHVIEIMNIQFNEKTILRHGNDAFKVAWESILKNETIFQQFNNLTFKFLSCKGNTELHTSNDIHHNIQSYSLCKQVLEKIFNARSNAVTSTFKDEHLSRWALKGGDISLRGQLKAMTKKDNDNQESKKKPPKKSSQNIQKLKEQHHDTSSVEANIKNHNVVIDSSVNNGKESVTNYIKNPYAKKRKSNSINKK